MMTTTKNLTESAARRLPKASTKAKDLYQIEGHLWLQHTGQAMSFIYMVNAKALQKSRIEVGLGSWQVEGDSNLAEGRVTRTWADARARTAELDAELKKGQHPRDIEQAFRAAMKAKPVAQVISDDPHAPPKGKQLTMRELVAEFELKSSTAQEWIGANTLAQFLSTMKNYVYPLIGDKLAHQVTPDDIFAVLTQDKKGERLWTAIHKQAKTMRQRLEKMFGYAKAEGHRRVNDSSNPASWQHFEHRLPRSTKIHVTKPHAHVRPDAIGDVYRALVAKGSNLTALALRLKILTIPRTAMILTAKWEDFDMEAKTWTVPGIHLKGDIQRKSVDFVIPLSDAALNLLTQIPGYGKRTGLLFPSQRGSKHGATMYRTVMTEMLERMGYKGVLTPHGMRHTFSTWRADETEFASELAEACLAHANGEGNKVAAVYNRASYVKRRREVMDAWGAYVTRPAAPANVVDISEGKRTRHAA
jgi:integrase